MRIMTNYAQMMATTMSYNMKFPDVLTEIFTPLQIVGSGSKTAFSMDCFSSNSEFSLFFPSPTIYKMFMLALMPVLIAIFIMAFLALLSIFKRVTFVEYKRNVVVSLIIILFLLHPTLTDTALSLFQ